MNGKIDAISRRVGSGGGSGRGVSDGEITFFHDFSVWHYLCDIIIIAGPLLPSFCLYDLKTQT